MKEDKNHITYASSKPYMTTALKRGNRRGAQVSPRAPAGADGWAAVKVSRRVAWVRADADAGGMTWRIEQTVLPIVLRR